MGALRSGYFFVCAACEVKGTGFTSPVRALEGWLGAHSDPELDRCEGEVFEEADGGVANPLIVIGWAKEGAEVGLDE